MKVLYSKTIYRDGEYATFPNLATLKDGRVICAFRHAKDRQAEHGFCTHIDPTAKDVFIASPDGGRSFDRDLHVIVDDEMISRGYMELFIKSSRRYEIAASLPFEGALAWCRENTPPDLVILDVMMTSGVDGLTAAGEIKRRYPRVEVKDYLDDMMEKSGIHSRTALVAQASRLGIVVSDADRMKDGAEV